MKNVLEQLPPELSGQLLDSMYKGTIKLVPLFANLEESALRDICLAMKPYPVQRGEYVYRENHLAREMFIVEEGRVQQTRHGMTIGVLGKGSFFGERALQPGRITRDRSSFALINSQLALLAKSDCERIAKDHPNLLHNFLTISKRRAKMQAVRMNRVLQEVAKDLGVHVQSSVMQSVVQTAEQLTGMEIVDKQERAQMVIARHVRGWIARKKVATKRSIEEGILSTNEGQMDAHLAAQISQFTVAHRVAHSIYSSRALKRHESTTETALRPSSAEEGKKKTEVWSTLRIKMIILPRQARDKHMQGKHSTRDAFLADQRVGTRSVSSRQRSCSRGSSSGTSSA
eukprot:COSAG06_NODE_9967_length_1780_cov_1.164783_1_plen_343_part_00